MKKFVRDRKINKIKKVAGMTLILFAISLFIGTFIYIDTKLRPTIMAVAETKGIELANRAINKSVAQIVKDEIDYEDLINIITDNNGKITMVKSNTILMNKIASDIALEIQDEIKQIKTTSAYIPIGTALGSPLLAKYGPQVKVSIQPLGSVAVNFHTQFESSGINQTRHRVYLTVKTQVKVIIPLTTSTKQVTTQVPVCETIIVGDVPQSYVNVPKDQLTNVLPDGSGFSNGKDN